MTHPAHGPPVRHPCTKESLAYSSSESGFIMGIYSQCHLDLYLERNSVSDSIYREQY